MSIGATLAHARQQAGLTIAEVSRKTRIREGIIRGIESDDFTECGGDFYARGHIRAVARAAGIDPQPLIDEYDRHWAEPDGTLTDVLGLLTASRGEPPQPGSRPGREDRGGPLNWPGLRWLTGSWALAVAAAMVVAAGLTGFALLSGTGGPGPAESLASRPPSRPSAGQGSGRPVPQPSRGPSAAVSVSPSAGGSRSVPSGRTRALTPAAAEAFGTGGAGAGDNADLARLAIDRSPATSWHSDWYTSASFGNLYPGTGLLLDMGHPVSVSRLRITLGGGPGTRLQLRVGSAPDLAALPAVARAASRGGVLLLRLARPARGRYVLIWFTRLPVGPAGTYQVSVYDVRVAGPA